MGELTTSESHVLEIACGTGILTEHIGRFTEPTVSILATDLSDGMLDYARRKRGALANTRFEAADAQSSPFDNCGLDADSVQFGIMFFSDRPRVFSEFARVLKSGGVLAYNVWASPGNNPIAKIAH